MFHKKFFSFSVALIAGLSLASSAAEAGIAAPLISVGGTPQTVQAGQPVTFTVTYSCGNLWSSAKVQLFNGTSMTASNKIGAETSLPAPTQYNEPITATITVTMPEPGSYSVNATTTEVITGGQPDTGCLVSSNAGAPITVTAPATTTSNPITTTVAPTTTMVRTLPKTGTGFNNALIAFAVALTGGAIILGRRRLITK